MNDETLFQECLKCILRRLTVVGLPDVPNIDDYHILKKFEEEKGNEE